MANDGFRTIKIYQEAYDKLQTIQEQLARDGWSSVGADRHDSATVANVMDEALIALAERGQKKGARR